MTTQKISLKQAIETIITHINDDKNRTKDKKIQILLDRESFFFLTIKLFEENPQYNEIKFSMGDSFIDIFSEDKNDSKGSFSVDGGNPHPAGPPNPKTLII